jgi:mevalonate kinase
VVYLGFKTPTPQVIQFVHARYDRWPPIFIPIFAAIGQTAASAKDIINRSEWSQLGELFFIHQQLQAALGVSSPEMCTLIMKICQLENVYGTKISGSGMGDCLIILGNPSPQDLRELNLTQFHPDARVLEVTLDKLGLRYE